MKKIKALFFYSKNSLRFIWKTNKEYLFLTVLSIIFDSVKIFPGMYLTSLSIDCLVGEADFGEYLNVIIGIIAVMILVAAFSMFTDNKLEYIKKRFYSDIRMQINDICMNTDFCNIQSKTFLESKTFAIEALDRDCLDSFIQSMRRVISCILIIGGVSYVISKSSLIILIALVVSLAINLYNDYLNARHNFTDTKEEVEYRRKSTYLQSISSDFSFAKEIRLFNLKNRFHKRMDEVDKLLFRARESRRKKRNSSAAVAYAAEAILDICMYLFYGYQVLVSAAITLGEFSLYINALRQLKSSVDDIIYTLTDFIVNTEYLDKFFTFIEQKTNSANIESKSAVASKAAIQFENVFFRYPNSEQYTLKNINITLNAGETLLIVGENGAGKSTFAKLLCGLYRPTEGRILFNGVDISAMEPQEYMRQVSAVFQDYKLFAMSISDNICSMHGKHGKNIDKIRNALTQTNMLDKVDGLCEKENTQLYRIFDENGVEFSGGEMQRLAISRAIYKDSPILVLDEPTSALDPKAEYEIYSSFQKISNNRTAVYISHRMSSTKFSDKIAVFKDGEISEYGTHDELMGSNGLYSELYSLQSSLYKKQTIS